MSYDAKKISFVWLLIVFCLHCTSKKIGRNQ
jgi:hypothetical protein